MSNSISVNNKRIAKNTLMLYFRMMLIMGITFYTSRVVLEALGVEDFGIYNVVGGIVSMLGVLNTAMSVGTQRYLSYELGKGDSIRFSEIYSMSINVHWVVALVVLILSETVGLFFLNYKMNILPDRMYAANWVYQFSILSYLMNILSVPYNAAIISNERMKVFAYVSIIDVFLKLGVVYILVLSDIDKLIVYSFLIFVSSFIVMQIYKFYCIRKIEGCRYLFSKDAKLFKELVSYSGWNMFGGIAVVFSNQGANLILNLFFGTTINAAYGIAMQVKNAVTVFYSNFLMALNPQIIKSYASGNVSYTDILISRGAKYCFFLLFIVSTPVLYYTSYCLSIWLKVVPDYTVVFTQLALVTAIANSLSGTVMTASQASGKIKWYQIIMGIVIMLNIPVSCVLLYFSFSPYSVLVVSFVFTVISVFMRIYLVSRLINISFFEYMKDAILPSILVLLIASFVFFLLRCFLLKNNDFISFSLFSVVSVLINIIIVLFVGLKVDERKAIKLYLFKNRI